ncbi:MAG TPA: AAA family ATPase [Ignavibacteriaceae bacterium]|nr:AAA family ATPase [Ignavibacteriaceae bacterium]
MIAGQAERIVQLKNFREEESKYDSCPVITFTSGKGGTGKTFTAINTAFLLSERKKVLLIDFNLNFSSLGTMLNLIPQSTIPDFLNSRVFFEDIIFHFTDNLHLIMGDDGNINNNGGKEDEILSFLQKLGDSRGSYDYILIDCPPGVPAEVLTAIKFADINIVVANTDPTSVMDAYAITKISTVNNLSGLNCVLFNKCIDENDAVTASENLQKAVNHFLGIEIIHLGYIPFEKDIMSSFQNQKIYLKEYPGTTTAKQFSVLLNRLEKNRQMANNHH